MAIALVQTVSNASTGVSFNGTSLAGTWGSNTTTGNTIIVCIANNGGLTNVKSIVDSQTNTYQKVVSQDSSTGASGTSDIWYAAGITGGTTPTVTVTLNSSVDNMAFIAREYSGLASSFPYDTNSHHQNLASTTPTSNSTATTQDANELLIGTVCTVTSNPSYTVGASYGNLLAKTGNAAGVTIWMAAEDQIVSATGTYAATFGSASVDSAVIIATFGDTNLTPPSVSTSVSDASTTSENLNLNQVDNVQELAPILQGVRIVGF